MPEQLPPPVTREDLAISLAVRQELGPEHDDAVVAEFLDRVGPAIDARVEARLANARRAGGAQRSSRATAVALGSLGMGIPITAITLGTTGGGPSGVVAMLVAWTGIAAVNVAHDRRADR